MRHLLDKIELLVIVLLPLGLITWGCWELHPGLGLIMSGVLVAVIFVMAMMARSARRVLKATYNATATMEQWVKHLDEYAKREDTGRDD